MRTNSTGSSGVTGQGSRPVATSTKPAAARRSARLLGRGEVPRPRPSRRGRRAKGSRSPTAARVAVEALHVALSPALGHQPPAGPQRVEHAREQGVVVGHPVEDGVGEDGVDRLVEHELGQVGLEHGGARRVERLARLRDHRRRRVHRHHVPVRQALEQHLGHPAGAAAGVQHGLVALQRQPRPAPAPPTAPAGRRRARRCARPSRALMPSAVVTGPERSRSAS